MEHILISPGKLKLMLTKSDLDKYDLDCDTIDSENTLTRQAFRELLADVKRVSGFDAADDKVFIQLYPSRDGGAEIYITRLSPKQEREPPTDEAVKLTNVYAFDSMQKLLIFCERLSRAQSLPKSSSAWHSDGTYFLICEERFTYREYLKLGRHDRFGEYLVGNGHRITSPAAPAYVKEHCVCIRENDAISALADLA